MKILVSLIKFVIIFTGVTMIGNYSDPMVAVGVALTIVGFWGMDQC